MSHVEDLARMADQLRNERASGSNVGQSQGAETEAPDLGRHLPTGVELAAARGPTARHRAAESYRRAAMKRACGILQALAERGLLQCDAASKVIQGVGGALDRLADAVAEDDVYEEIAAIEEAETILGASPF